MKLIYILLGLFLILSTGFYLYESDIMETVFETDEPAKPLTVYGHSEYGITKKNSFYNFLEDILSFISD